MSKLRDPNTRVRINPDTYIKFDGSDKIVLQNILSDQGLSIKYDILLILYDLVNWQSVGELIAPWPPVDQEKILEHLEKLHAGKIIAHDGEESTSLSESGLSTHLGSGIHINAENHHAMLRDTVRMHAYRRAIENSVKQGDVVLDLGCGTGVLSFFAARAGASRVFAIEKRPDILMLAEGLAKANGLDAKITFIEGASSLIKEAEIEPKADLLVSEILGNAILEENVLEFTLDARDRFLKPDAKLLPAGLDIYLFAFETDFIRDFTQEVSELSDMYSLDFSLLGNLLTNKITMRTERYNPHANNALSKPLLVKSLDFKTLEVTTFAQDFQLPIDQSGNISGFCAYFRAHLDEENTLTNSPWAPQTHWTQLCFYLPEPIPVQKGQSLPLQMIYDGSIRLSRTGDPAF